MSTLKFTKMHGLGNDFMVIDGINQVFQANKQQIQQWGNRNLGIGFDQLLVVENSSLDDCLFKYRIFNADGAEVEQCGNGARCFARFVIEKKLTDQSLLNVETKKGKIELAINADNTVTVDMGKPYLQHEDIPFIPTNNPENLTHIFIDGTLTIPFTTLGMGNPHAVVVVENLDNTPVDIWGAKIARSAQFPESVNVGFMQIIDKKHIVLKVFERGVGITLACGTGACAAVVAGVGLGLLDEHVTVTQSGGDIDINWKNQQNVLMSGPATTVFEGEIKINE